MRPEQQPDWRSKESYAYTMNLTRLGWAWEFLRRNPDFQADYRKAPQQCARALQGDLRRWGVLRADDPHRNALEARVFWDPSVCSHVLPLAAGHRVSNARGDRLPMEWRRRGVRRHGNERSRVAPDAGGCVGSGARGIASGVPSLDRS